LPIDDPSLWDTIREISLSVWVTGGIMLAAFFWFVKWMFVVLFVQGKGIGLVTVPVSRMAGKILEDKFAQKFADSKLLPKLHPPQNWEEFNRFTGHVADRMRTYRELVYLVQKSSASVLLWSARSRSNGFGSKACWSSAARNTGCGVPSTRCIVGSLARPQSARYGPRKKS
jgi:hypothetical protein